MTGPRPIPLIAPNPPRLSTMAEALARVEASGVFSNNGPEVRGFEADATEHFFGGEGACLAVGNATLGLMIAIRAAAGDRPASGTMALMPALTFAATAQAAVWAGLTPLVCDIDPDDWGACAVAEERLLRAHGASIGVIVPYATFGNVNDLDRYAWFQRRYGVGVVVDAASSLGARDDRWRGFGQGADFAVVHSMHATKPFGVAEGGLIHSGNVHLIERLRAMANFGFQGSRSAAMPGLNAKLPEVLAVMARAKLAGYEAVAEHRAGIERAYREGLSGFQLQRVAGARRASQFMPVLLPAHLAPRRDEIAAAIETAGIGVGRYFSPHLGEQSWIRATSQVEPTPVADAVAGRMLSLPIHDTMTPADAERATRALALACAALERRSPARVRDHRPAVAETLVVGGGPAGTAMLTAASKDGRLAALARGLVLVERDAGIGQGQLGRYAITSDSTAQTFLTAVRDNPYPAIAALADHPVGRAVAAHEGGLGVPLVEAGPLLRETGERLAAIVRREGGTVLTGHEALDARRDTDGLWRVRLRRLGDGVEIEQLTRSLVIATGGHQPLDRLAMQRVAGRPLVELAGERLVQSDAILTLGGYEMAADLLSRTRAPKVAVIGGSTSALTSVALLLKGRPAIPFGAGGITLLHRRPLRPFYPSVEAARAEGFADYGADDICPVSGFVYRLGGFRLEARELVLRMLGIDGRAADPRVVAHRLGDDDAAAARVLAQADLVVAALGYRPRGLALLDREGAAVRLAADGGAPMVDGACRVLGADGVPVPGVYGIGLAAGFVPSGRLGGEVSFSGQANGLWLWQNDVGAMIVDQILAQRARAVA